MVFSRMSLIRVLKGNGTVRWLATTTLAEVVGESLNRQLPLGYRIMRLVSRSNYLRDAAIRRQRRATRPAISTVTRTGLGGLDVDQTVTVLNEKGFAVGIALPPDCLAKILTFCSKAPFIDDYNPDPLLIDMVDETVPRPGRLAYRCVNPHKVCEAVDKLTRDPAIVAVARGYLKTEPLLRSSRIFWSYPDLSEGYSPLWGFHYDIDDYKFLKLFFYLNDVDIDRGPHVIIEGTHQRKNWFEKNHRRLTDGQAESRYKDRIRVMTGSAGCGFFEDTFCYHKGAKPQKRRLVLEFEYALSMGANPQEEPCFRAANAGVCDARNFMTSVLCPVCVADSCSPLETLEHYHLYRCHNCELQFWDPMRNPGHQWYEEAARYVLRDKVRDRPRLYWRHRQFLRRTLPQGSRILDMGCGVGAFVAHCEAKGYEAIGIDIDRNAIAAARDALGLRQVYALSLDEFTQRPEAHRFDAITFFEVLEHLDEPARFISTIKRLLKPAGCIALSVPNRARWHLLPLEDVPPNHLTRWNVAALGRFLDSQGFEVLEISENPLSLQLATSVVSGKLNDWVPGLRHLKLNFLSRSAKLVTSPEESRARAARRGYRLLAWLWTTALYAPAGFVVPYARLTGKKGDCIYCLAQLRSGNGLMN